MSSKYQNGQLHDENQGDVTISKTVKYISDPTKIPEEPHLGIIKQFSYAWEGYGQSNTDHGLKYEIYKDEEEWKAEIIKLHKQFAKFRAVRVVGLNFEIKVEVEIPDL